MTVYYPAPDVAHIAGELIENVTQHKRLAEVRVDYVFREKHSKSKGRAVLGKARKLSGLNAWLLNGEPMFVIEIARDTWLQLDLDGQRALVDHELCHCRVDFDDDGEPQLDIRGHDLEEFAEIIERHGLWKSDVAAFGSAVAEQLVLAVEQTEDWLRDLTDEDEDGDEQ